ncbi:MAG TPA: hypothetical protein VK533_09550 [Sphingomonas sp.]|uniref:hypothetical protein n=1 Tax=Sphingomonas sp. TaxID=28214 RepID=UPI002CE790BE|nr:hypothetical protein [Sphingomonas sp.]HMI19777.1 hypothetical protein [Sphingomonas sp.]
MSIGQRLFQAISDRRNVAGLVGAATGLGLMYGGVIEAGWLAITAGLYGAGFLAVQIAAPPSDFPRLANGGPVTSAADLPDALRRLAGRVGPDLPPAARKHLDSILVTATSIQGRLAEMDAKGIDATPFQQLLAGYVPDTLRAYERVPAALRAKVRGASGKTPDQQIDEQLGLLADQMEKLVEVLAQGDMDAIETQTRFLQARFATAEPFE